ncbi:MAG: GNAT family N-acetyltransferase, partial [Reichenbachiella sp.]
LYGIGRIVTHANSRGKGVGRQLIRKAIEDIQQIKGISSILIHGQSHLEAYYNTFGFKVCSEEYLEDDIPHYDMIIEF